MSPFWVNKDGLQTHLYRNAASFQYRSFPERAYVNSVRSGSAFLLQSVRDVTEVYVLYRSFPERAHVKFINIQYTKPYIYLEMQNYKVYLPNIVNTSNSLAMQEEAFGSTINASKLRVEYRLRSNLDTAYCYVMRRDSRKCNTSIPPTIRQTGAFDTNHTYLYDVSTQSFYTGFKVWAETYSGIPNPYYIYYSNIRVIKAE